MSDTPQQFRLREVCRHLLGAGIKPTPTVLEQFEASFIVRRGTNITLSHGRLTKVRTEEFMRAGWVKVVTPDSLWSGRWIPFL